jgi:hypothetical protein
MTAIKEELLLAKDIANCTCRSCGKDFEKVLYDSGKGAMSRLAKKRKWAEDGGIDLCTDCWKQNLRDYQKSLGLVADVRLSNPLIDEFMLYVVFDGDTYSHKDELKAQGARWTRYYPDADVMGTIFNIDLPPMRWVLTASDKTTLNRILHELPINSVTYPSNQDITLWMAAKKESKRIDDEKKKQEAAVAEKREAALAQLGPMPSWPITFSAKWPKGSTWNGKVYGKPGARCVYFSGEQIHITDEEAVEAEKTFAARAEWRCRKEEIEKGIIK